MPATGSVAAVPMTTVAWPHFRSALLELNVDDADIPSSGNQDYLQSVHLLDMHHREIFLQTREQAVVCTF